MDTTLAGVELLERAIGYTRGNLALVTDDLLDRPTPCARWRLGQLLDHMADSLDAFTEASSGLVPLDPAPAGGTPVEVLRTKACALLGAWSSPAAAMVQVGAAGAVLAAPLLLPAGALEITLHGWDVGRAVGADVPLPEGLAAALLPVAHALIGPADRGRRFGPEVQTGSAGAVAPLLGFCGRSPRWHHG